MREPDKQRFLDAVVHRQRPDVPLYEMEADILIVEQMLDRQLPRALHSFELPVPDMIEWNRCMGNDMVYFSHVWHLGRKEQADADGRLHYVDGTMKTRESLDSITYPDLDALRRRLEDLCAELDGTGFGVVCGTQTAGFTVPTAMTISAILFVGSAIYARAARTAWHDPPDLIVR